MEPPPRIARLVLITRGGDLIGVLPPLAASTPWWQDMGPVCEAVQTRFGAEVAVLRLLEAERDAPPGGLVTYLAELVRGDPPAVPWTGTLDEHPLRLPYARPGGPDADLDWANVELARRGAPLSGRPRQDRTWNLSSLWRLPIDEGAAWLKVVPPFLAHEGALLERLIGEAVPTVWARDAGRLLMPEIGGADLYDAPLETLFEMVTLLVGLQGRWSGRADELMALGLPDWRGAALAAAIADLVTRRGGELAAEERGVLERFAAGLPKRLAAVAALGLEDGLVHGDFHPGNFRGVAGSLTLLDWGDSGVGHPLLDQPAFLTRIAAGAVKAVRDHWHDAWRASVPGSDPVRTAHLLAPVAAARQALIYQGFLDRIEPSEHPYHRADPLDWLKRCAALAA